MKAIALTITNVFFFLTSASLLYSQECKNYFVPDSLIGPSEGEDRAGSCASPDGAVMIIGAYPPDYAYLDANGYCFSISPASKDITVCYTFTSPGTNVELNAGYSSSGCSLITFNNFKLYTCAPACTFIGSGLVFAGLTAGTCYTWCFHAKCTGPGPGFDHFCPYYLNTTVLSIDLSYFEGVSLGEQNLLSWETLSELNNERFEILRSSDGVNFELIAVVGGNGTSSKTHTYSFIDQSPLPGTNYYILNQVDYDGKFTSSPIIQVTEEKSGATKLILNQNPVENSLNATIACSKEGTSKIHILDITGKLIFTDDLNLVKGLNSIQIDVSDIPKGTYIISILNANDQATTTFIK